VWSVAAHAQQPIMPVIGLIRPGSPEVSAPFVAPFRQGLMEGGYVEGQNVSIAYRWTNDRSEQIPALAADLVRRRVAVIAAVGVSAALAAKASTTTIPIVFQLGVDPVKTGLVASLNRPGGNVTGVTNVTGGLTAKRLALLHELAPRAATVGILLDPSDLTFAATKSELQQAADTLRLQLIFLEASSERDFDAAFASLVQQKAGALLLTDETLFNSRRAELVALSARHAIPTIYTFREFAAAGGLMSYASSLTDANRLSGVYTARILKGEKPGDLPVMQPTKFEFVINLKTAKALGLAFPPSLLAIADEVIE
jgi:putative ABC transport system substrate-binding protein